MPPDGPAPFTGQCYCGRSRVLASEAPLTVVYCHCPDCRRVSGAPVAAFAAFRETSVTLNPERAGVCPLSQNVTRRFCPDCGTPLTAEFDYLPGQVYVPLGILDQADTLPPGLHCHADKALPWLCIVDEAKRVTGTARDTLGTA